MERGQPDDLVALGFKERNGGNDERIRTPPTELGKAGFKFAFRAGLENMDLPANCARRVLKMSQLVRAGNKAWIHQHSDDRREEVVRAANPAASVPKRSKQEPHPCHIAPGRLKLAMIPSFTGSAPVAKTIEFTDVAFLPRPPEAYSRPVRPPDDGRVQPPQPASPLRPGQPSSDPPERQVLPLDKTCLPPALAKSSHKSGWLAGCRACVDKAD